MIPAGDEVHKKGENIDVQVVSDFGAEWERFDQSSLSGKDHSEIFKNYFNVFPLQELDSNSIGADIGCGSGRWASIISPLTGHLHLVDASADALAVAKKNLSGRKNVSYHNYSVDELPFEESSLDFAYSLGVLHHVPNTRQAIASIFTVLKPGAPFLLYLYYAFDQRPWWFRAIWKLSDMLRKVIYPLPVTVKNLICDIIALGVYWPLARTARILDYLGILTSSWPLSYYRTKSFYVMRTDALDRFGTRLEQRFSRLEIKEMLESAGFKDIVFSDSQPYWCAIGIK